MIKLTFHLFADRRPWWLIWTFAQYRMNPVLASISPPERGRADPSEGMRMGRCEGPGLDCGWARAGGRNGRTLEGTMGGHWAGAMG